MQTKIETNFVFEITCLEHYLWGVKGMFSLLSNEGKRRIVA